MERDADVLEAMNVVLPDVAGDGFDVVCVRGERVCSRVREGERDWLGFL